VNLQWEEKKRDRGKEAPSSSLHPHLSNSSHPPHPHPPTPTPQKIQIITIMSFFMLMPVQLLIEGGPFLPHRIAELVRGGV
jgi:hypothetical protein